MQAVIEVEHLTNQYGSFRAVDGLSFSVYKGDVFGFLGQNGAGKSTTIRMLLSLIKPSEGTIRIFGQELLQHRNSILARTGAVIEKPDLYGYLTGFENLKIFARMSGGDTRRERLQAVLEMVGLQDRSQDTVRTYSQGMKQRLGIATALVHDPDLIILDEPTNGLDPQGIADIRNLILRLSREEQKTFLVSSHLLAEMELIANRMLIIDRGKKIVEGLVRELVDPGKLVLEIGTTDDAACYQKLSASAWSNQLRPLQSGRIMMDLSRDEVPDLVKALVGMDVLVRSLKPVNTLEEYFLSLTKENEHVVTGSN